VTAARELRVYAMVCCALIGGGFAYASADWGQWPRIHYMPLAGTLTLAPVPGQTAMGYWGLIAWGLGGAVIGAGAGAVIARTLPEAWWPRVAKLFGAWALTALALAGAYFTWQLLAV
jgi:hypothetical protein